MTDKGEDPRGSPQALALTGKGQPIRSTDLFRSSRCIIIEHAGENYCLRLTRNERLILTKI